MVDVRNLGKNHGKNKVYVRDLGINHVNNFLRKIRELILEKLCLCGKRCGKKSWRQHLVKTNLGRNQGNIILRFIS
jgi:hypothetical protein